MPRMPKTFDFSNLRSRYPIAYDLQAVSTKNEIIAKAEEIIEKMQERLKTEKNPKIRARCEDIIKNQQETIERERKAKEIIRRNPFGPLCSSESRQH